MLRIGARLALFGWRLETCVPMQACVPRFLPAQRSSTRRQGSSSLPGASRLLNAQCRAYRAPVAAWVAVHQGTPGSCTSKPSPLTSSLHPGRLAGVLRSDFGPKPVCCTSGDASRNGRTGKLGQKFEISTSSTVGNRDRKRHSCSAKAGPSPYYSGAGCARYSGATPTGDGNARPVG